MISIFLDFCYFKHYYVQMYLDSNITTYLNFRFFVTPLAAQPAKFGANVPPSMRMGGGAKPAAGKPKGMTKEQQMMMMKGKGKKGKMMKGKSKGGVMKAPPAKPPPMKVC
jgi:hypothetical protein